MCTLQGSDRTRRVFFRGAKFRVEGAFIFWSLDTNHHQLCTEQCPEFSEQSEYTFKYFYLTLFQIFLRARALRKKIQDGIPFLVSAPLPSHIMLELASPHRKFGSNPCNYVCKTINGIIGKIPLQNLVNKPR